MMKWPSPAVFILSGLLARTGLALTVDIELIYVTQHLDVTTQFFSFSFTKICSKNVLLAMKPVYICDDTISLFFLIQCFGWTIGRASGFQENSLLQFFFAKPV